MASNVKKIPDGYTSVTPSFTFKDSAKAIEFYKSAFGAQVHPKFGTRTYRNGVDIEAAQGTEVAAVFPGSVIYTGWFKGYGNLIILDHGNDYYTLYAHVADILVKEGDDVRQGGKIATVGDTGALTGPRLYFEVRYQGKPQDPEQWLRHQQRG